MKLFLVRSPDNQGKYERWWELVVAAKDETEAKDITFPHPDFATGDSVFSSVPTGDIHGSLSGLPYREKGHGYWYPNRDNLEVIYLGETSLTESGAISGYYDQA
ncbi:hypothetical protein [Klebsiella quasipneumoniae]|uniref:hypothetical protein n=1 Tax=Klebsiella quasipneumoniae TaxID=1463165 RepID=UPI0023B03EB4|nr:hypothetical protein [Klebsiella quasipneumoniae]